MKNIKENEWRNHPIVIVTGALILYTISSSIFTIFNF